MKKKYSGEIRIADALLGLRPRRYGSPYCDEDAFPALWTRIIAMRPVPPGGPGDARGGIIS